MDKHSFQFLLKIQMILCKYVNCLASRLVLNLSLVVRLQEDNDTYYCLSLFFPGEFCFAWSFCLYWDIFERIFSHSFYRIWIDLISEPCVRIWLVAPTISSRSLQLAHSCRITVACSVVPENWQTACNAAFISLCEYDFTGQ